MRNRIYHPYRNFDNRLCNFSWATYDRYPDLNIRSHFYSDTYSNFVPYTDAYTDTYFAFTFFWIDCIQQLHVPEA